MHGHCLKSALAALLLSLACICARAQKHCIGTVYGYSGIGLYHEHDTGDGSFTHVALHAETAEAFSGRTSIPGISASFTWNFALAIMEQGCGNKITIFAGPGIAAGFCRDFKSDTGFFFGLKGRAGVSCSYRRNVDISISIAPVIGPHLTFREDAVNMKYFKGGLMRAFMPEIGIGYRF